MNTSSHPMYNEQVKLEAEMRSPVRMRIIAHAVGSISIGCAIAPVAAKAEKARE